MTNLWMVAEEHFTFLREHQKLEELSQAIDYAAGHLPSENSETRAKRTGEANQKLFERSEFF